MPKKTMGERMAVLETKVEGIKETVERVEETLTEYIKQDKKTHEDLANKYAGKWIEKAFWIILTALVGIVAFIIQNALVR